MAESTHEDDIREIHRLLHGERPMTDRDREECEAALRYMAGLPRDGALVAPADMEPSG